MNKTIKEMANELSVSKQTIQYHLKHMPTNYTTKSDKNLILIKPIGQKALLSKIDKRNTANNTTITDKEKESFYKTFKDQIEIKDEQIKKLQESQLQLQKLLDQQQILTLQANKKIEQLEYQVQEKEEEEQQEAEPTEPKSETKKGFFNRLFNK